jgi:hypothetical protein
MIARCAADRIWTSAARQRICRRLMMTASGSSRQIRLVRLSNSARITMLAGVQDSNLTPS